jgi:hypothetical protein
MPVRSAIEELVMVTRYSQRSKGGMVRKADVKNALTGLGIRPGEVLAVHSSLSSIGRVEGGPDTLIDALVETVGPEGAIVMPSYSMSLLIALSEDRRLAAATTEQGMVVMVDLFDPADTVIAVAHEDGHNDNEGPTVPTRLAFTLRRLKHREYLACSHGGEDRRQERVHD